jgi:hypothetical protein
MEKQLLDEIVKKTEELMAAPTCSKETKESARRWLAAVGTAKEREETRIYLEALEEDIMPIGQLIGFAGSEAGRGYFGEEKAAEIVRHAQEIQAAGAKYCDCPACAVVEEILAKKEEMWK